MEKKTEGYTLDDLPNPKHHLGLDGNYVEPELSADAKAITIALLAIVSEIRQTRALMEAASEINRMQLEHMKEKMGEAAITKVVFTPGGRQH